MSKQYPGGLITKTPVTPAGPYETGAAPGIWTLDQQAAYAKQGIWPTAGLQPNYIEDVFSTWLYTGTGGTAQSINNGIDLAGKGGLVWIKSRSNAYAGGLQDTARGASFQLIPSQTVAQYNNTTNGFTSFNNNGFSLQNDYTYDGSCNFPGSTFASWTFRKQPKFFDVVTYTGTGSVQNIAHNLGSVPGCIIVKRTDTAASWRVYHRSTGNDNVLYLNLTNAVTNDAFAWNSTTPTSTVFTVGADSGVNASGGTYVAYLFAHNAGGFGLTGTDNVISCGSFTLDGSNTAIVTLGYEPQWVMIKRTNSTGNWIILDNMRGLTTSGVDAALRPNTSGAETNGQEGIYPTATGFGANTGLSSSGDTYIYIAIRRGPMKVPTDGTKVFSPIARNGTAGVATVTTTNLPDSIWSMNRAGSTGYPAFFYDRLRGANTFLIDNTSAETYDAANSSRYSVTEFNNLSYALGVDGNYAGINGLTSGYSNWVLSRAPGFFDEVCYTGTGSTPLNIAHNLTVAPELVIVKTRNSADDWTVLNTLGTSTFGFMYLNYTDANTVTSYGSGAQLVSKPTTTNIPFGAGGSVNSSATTYVAYLFATCAGVSKVGSYTGNGSTQTINCGFTGGARFVLIKRTDSTGDWYVWDTARGMVSGTDPSLLLNSTAAEVNANSIYTATGGFQIVSTAAGINASGGTFIFFAVA